MSQLADASIKDGAGVLGPLPYQGSRAEKAYEWPETWKHGTGNVILNCFKMHANVLAKCVINKR